MRYPSGLRKVYESQAQARMGDWLTEGDDTQGLGRLPGLFEFDMRICFDYFLVEGYRASPTKRLALPDARRVKVWGYAELGPNP